MPYPVDEKWAREIQPFAIMQVYKSVWPDCEVIELDDDRKDNLKTILDISGADKMLRWPNGGVSFLAQRFRRYKHRKHDDFTLRAQRPSGRATEAEKVLEALSNNRLLAAHYAYGHVNEKENGFLRFKVFDFVRFLEDWCNGFAPDELKWNKDGSSSFWCWRFSRFPDDLFLYK